MGKYAFQFEHKLQNSKKGSTVIEYFIPYSQDELLTIISSRRLAAIIRRSKKRSVSFDHFVEKYNLQNEKYIANINQSDFENNSSLWINDTENIYDLSMWDYLADAIAVTNAYRYHYENIDYVNTLADITMFSRIKFFYTRVILSLLVYIDDDENNDFYHSAPEKGPLPESSANILNSILHNLERARNGSDSINLIKKSRQYALELSSDRIRTIIIRTCDIILSFPQQENNDFTVYASVITNCIRDVKIVLKGMYREQLHTLYAYETLTLHNAVPRNTTNRNTIMPVLSQRLAYCMNKATYHSAKYNYISDTIRQQLQNFQNIEEAIDNSSLSFYSTLHNLRRYLTVDAPRWTQKAYGDNEQGTSCYALLITHSGKRYFALSGGVKELTSNCSSGKAGQLTALETLVKNIMENIFADPAKHVVVQNPRNSGFYFDWCYLDDTSPARRYTEILDNGSEDPSKYIPFYEEFRNDINNHSLNNKEIGNTYGCCERKMLAFSGYQDVSEIYSRWAPCWRCRPAILDTQPCDYYAFEPAPTQNKISSQLKKYRVVPQINYTVTSI